MGIMNFTKNQNKRMRLDLEGNFDVNVGNDDLWGQEDITADEFDILEFQATQSVQTTSVNNAPLQVDSNKQAQYELEGKIKILSDSIETTKKELVEEKLKRDKIVAEKTYEFEEKEKQLQKQIEKLLSSLQFKDQEMKAVHDKVKTLEVQLKENKVISKPSTSKSPNKYLEKFDFKADVPVRSLESRLLQQKKLNRTFTLSIDTPKGQTRGCDIVSSILCNRLFPPQIPTLHSQSDLEHSHNRILLSPVSVTKLSLEQNSPEIFQFYSSILENYLHYLQAFSDKTNSSTSTSTKNKDFVYERTIVISCLKDLCYIASCSQFSDAIHSLHIESLVQEAKKASQSTNNTDSSSTSSSSIHDKYQEKHATKTCSLLALLFLLSKPETYPKGVVCKEEVEWTLSVMVSWSATNPKSFIGSFNNAVISSHINNCFSITAAYTALKILVNICTQKEYASKAIHNKVCCHLCAIATLLTRPISNSPLDCIDLMIMAEDFLSSVFSVHTFTDLKLENSPCSMKILQALLTTLLKFSNIRNGSCDLALLLKKGFTLLHYLSKYIPNLKLRRVDFEDLYISTVCAMLSLSKEDTSFRDFQEIAHELWDFQEDTSEFDLEDLSDDSTQAVNLKSQSES